MRIISKFHDYYDGVAAYDQDRSLVYHRTAKEYQYREPETPFYNNSSYDKPKYPLPKCEEVILNYRHRIDIQQIIVGFCGKIYPILKCQKSQPCWFRNDDMPKVDRDCTSIEHFDAFICGNFNSKFCSDYYNVKQAKGKRKCFEARMRDSILGFFKDVEDKQDSYVEMFLTELSPLFVSRYQYGTSNIIFNDNLRNVNFPSLFPQFDAYTSYQEISMFLGNLAFPEKPMPIIEDEVMAGIKGFDKYSFRTPKKERVL